jgi:hypothetical protein
MSGIKITGEEAAVASAVELVKETLGLDEAGKAPPRADRGKGQRSPAGTPQSRAPRALAYTTSQAEPRGAQRMLPDPRANARMVDPRGQQPYPRLYAEPSDSGRSAAAPSDIARDPAVLATYHSPKGKASDNGSGKGLIDRFLGDRSEAKGPKGKGYDDRKGYDTYGDRKGYGKGYDTYGDRKGDGYYLDRGEGYEDKGYGDRKGPADKGYLDRGKGYGESVSKGYDEMSYGGRSQGSSVSKGYDEMSYGGRSQGSSVSKGYDEMSYGGRSQGSSVSKGYDEMSYGGRSQGSYSGKGSDGKSGKKGKGYLEAYASRSAKGKGYY